VEILEKNPGLSRRSGNPVINMRFRTKPVVYCACVLQCVLACVTDNKRRFNCVTQHVFNTC